MHRHGRVVTLRGPPSSPMAPGGAVLSSDQCCPRISAVLGSVLSSDQMGEE